MLRKILLALALLSASVVGTAPAASAGPAACDTRVNNTIKKLLECITVEGVREHQAAWQDIADANGGTRESGSQGYDDSADYVAGLMEGAGYEVSIQEFDFPFFEELSPGILEQITPIPTSYPYFDNAGFATMDYSGSGDVTAATEGARNQGVPQ